MSTNHSINRVVVVGGGAAGWLVAGTIAANRKATPAEDLEVLLVESPDVGLVGVGEGTWPTMRGTLERLGIRESEFIRECDASFKQGTKFCGWVTGGDDDYYYHPFTLPADYPKKNLAASWYARRKQTRFADAVCVQSHLCDRGLAPKQLSTPEYAAFANYAYHLNAGKFAQFLQKHCTETLNVKHRLDHLTHVNTDDDGYIRSLNGKQYGEINGDLFIDCSGFHAFLIGKHYQIPFIGKKDVLFIDSALASQAPYVRDDSPIASQTISTAQSAGWIWDIGLQSRQGIGYVYCSDYQTDAKAEAEIRAYIKPKTSQPVESVELRKISINPGHRQKFWHKNCVAVGLAAGFVEPLEASALVMVEVAAAMLSEQLPANRDVMAITAKRFNEKFLYHWERVIDFLKLHYVLSKREDTDFWIDNRNKNTIPDSLRESLALWRHQFPWRHDFTHAEEIFSSASYQYVLYGMSFETIGSAGRGLTADEAARLFGENTEKANKLLAILPENRELIEQIIASGLRVA